MVDAHYLNSMVEMGHGIGDGGLTVGAQETIIECDLHHSACGCQAAHLLIREIAGMVAEGTATAMTAHNRTAADADGIIEG
jgi:hypothetical protein